MAPPASRAHALIKAWVALGETVEPHARPPGDIGLTEALLGQQLPGFEERCTTHVQRFESQCRALRDDAEVVAIPTAAQMILEQDVDGVERARSRPAGDYQLRADRADDVLLVAERAGIKRRGQRSQPIARPHHQFMLLRGLEVGHDRQPHTGDLGEVLGQLLRRGPDRLVGVAADDDPVDAVPVLGQHHRPALVGKGRARCQPQTQPQGQNDQYG